MLKTPLSKASDSHLHRHLAQLTATLALFLAETGTIKALALKGVDTVGAALLYVSDEGSELHELPDWWRRRGERLLTKIA